jgi:hypothetical protein
VTDRFDLRSGRIWWVPATLLVAWILIAALPIPAWLGWTYTIGNLIGTGIALRLQVARQQEWGDARRDRRPLLRLLCVAQIPSGWATIALAVVGID